ncbi:hypothetical protein BpHYR1_021661 [Brachionus plicatilis]|uniref:Uncharacterized protein n=1 Tax=Brachionus plicatilis TaxID=10195 RepID=A0A3M7RUV7_BRAPC|nr:hypothetical protein BpHYR1_021661 [Brachionus plicatilis]
MNRKTETYLVSFCFIIKLRTDKQINRKVYKNRVRFPVVSKVKQFRVKQAFVENQITYTFSAHTEKVLFLMRGKRIIFQYAEKKKQNYAQVTILFS